MPVPRLIRTEAVVLRQRPLGDADKICVFFTPTHGRIEAVAKGVRRTGSRLAGHVEPLTRCTVQLAKGRNLDIVTGAQGLESFPVLHADIDRVGRAVYAAELIDRSTDTSAEAEPLYELLLATLRRLEAGGSPDVPVRWFELQFLAEQGYRPEVEACVRCRTPLGPEGNAFAPGLGGVLCENCRVEAVARPLSARAFKLIRYMLRSSYADVARVRIDAAVGAELERHLRAAVEVALDQEVRSAGFIEAVRSAGRPREAAGGS